VRRTRVRRAAVERAALTVRWPCSCARCAGEAGDWRGAACAAAPASGSAGRAFRVAGTVAIVAALAVTTLVFLTGDEETAALAAKVAAAAAPAIAAPVAAAKSAAAAAAAGPGAAKLAAAGAAKAARAPAKGLARAGKGTQKMSDNWKINENLPDSPTYSDLEREVSELEKEEKQHFNTRAASMTKAMTSADTDGDKTGLKNLKWKNAKDKYEQAAFKDIMDEEKERIKDSITAEGAQMFQQYEQKAQSLMGTEELKKLQNDTALAEKKRSMAEKSALIALRTAHVQLKKVEAEQDAARDQEDKKKQERANAKIAAHLQAAVDRESGSKEYYEKVRCIRVFSINNAVWAEAELNIDLCEPARAACACALEKCRADVLSAMDCRCTHLWVPARGAVS